MTQDISSSADIIDIRAVIERYEELEDERNTLDEEDKEAFAAQDAALNQAPDADYDLAKTHEEKAAALAEWDEDNGEEYKALKSLLEELCGYGGDHQWKGDWYPVTLIRDSYFVDAMQEMVEDIGDMPKGFPSYLEIDWQKTADNLQQDYSSVEYDGVTYWYR